MITAFGTFVPCKPTAPFVSFQRYFCRAPVVVKPVDPDPQLSFETHAGTWEGTLRRCSGEPAMQPSLAQAVEIMLGILRALVRVKSLSNAINRKPGVDPQDFMAGSDYGSANQIWRSITSGVAFGDLRGSRALRDGLTASRPRCRAFSAIVIRMSVSGTSCRVLA